MEDYGQMSNGTIVSDDRSNSILDDEQYRAYEMIISGKNVHICGAAGTGKSHLLTRAVRALRQIDNGSIKVAVMAPTGVAVSNLNNNDPDMGATTIHWWMGIQPKKEFDDMKNGIKMSRAEERWKNTNVIVIDEISMVSPELFEQMDRLAKYFRQNQKPFGGMQVILTGDWFQLEPVRNPQTTKEEYKDITFCFETETWKNTIPNDHVIILTKNYRQNKDEEFQKLLDEIREGVLSYESIQILKGRVGAELDLPQGIRATYIMSRRKDVEQENARALNELNSQSMTFTASRLDYQVTDSEKKRLFRKLSHSIRVDETIVLKIGAPVMLIVNLAVDRGLVNGLQGIVTEFDEEDGFPHVQFANGRKLKIENYTWTEAMPKRGGRFKGVCIRQLPIKLAAAMTIHKSQSITLDYVKLDLGDSVFAGGQAYTGLSRCRTLSGLSLTKFSPSSIMVNPKVIAFYKQFSALKYRLIDDGDSNGSLTDLILSQMKEHIPSAFTSRETTSRKRRRVNPVVKKPSFHDDNDVNCPL